MVRKERKKRPLKVTPEVINTWKRRKNPETGRNYTQAEIARMYGVTPAYITWVKKEYGGVIKSTSEMFDEMWPWDVPRQFHPASPNLRLRDHLRFMETGGRGMNVERLQLLKGFYNRLRRENVVVEFDPDIPPSEGIYTGGWAYRPRRPEDEDLIIRVNKYTKEMTDEMKFVWTLPPDDPEIPVPAPR